jgi:glyoxylase-like metal-dependent hydrolase (beta-lactamase superfamily II)
VDCGLGDKDNQKFKEMYKVGPYALESALAKHQLRPEDITDIIATHLHFDHMGGLTKFDAAGKITARFPQAKIWIQKRNWDHAWQPNEKDRASYLLDNFSIYEHDSKLQLLSGPEEIYPGIRVQISEGHTLGMQLPYIFDNQNSLLYCADIIPMSAHVRIPWVMGYDCFPVTSIQEKKQILQAAEQNNTMIFFEHCPYMDAARVHWTGKDFTVKEKINL